MTFDRTLIVLAFGALSFSFGMLGGLALTEAIGMPLFFAGMSVCAGLHIGAFVVERIEHRRRMDEEEAIRLDIDAHEDAYISIVEEHSGRRMVQ